MKNRDAKRDKASKREAIRNARKSKRVQAMQFSLANIA